MLEVRYIVIPYVNFKLESMSAFIEYHNPTVRYEPSLMRYQLVVSFIGIKYVSQLTYEKTTVIKDSKEWDLDKAEIIRRAMTLVELRYL